MRVASSLFLATVAIAAVELPSELLVTVPAGVTAGKQLNVTVPTGGSMLVTVPAGVVAGQQLKVQLPASGGQSTATASPPKHQGSASAPTQPQGAATAPAKTQGAATAPAKPHNATSSAAARPGNGTKPAATSRSKGKAKPVKTAELTNTSTRKNVDWDAFVASPPNASAHRAARAHEHTRGGGTHFVLVMCVLALSMPITVAGLLIIRSRRAAAGAGPSNEPGGGGQYGGLSSQEDY